MARIPPIELDPKTGWSEWQDTGFTFRVICCDCGLTHLDEYKIVNGRLKWRTRIDKVSTSNARRKKKK